MKRTKITLVIISTLSALLLFISVNGLRFHSLNIPRASERISLGLDMIGGSEISYSGQIPENADKDEAKDGLDMQNDLLHQHLDDLGYSDAKVVRDSKNFFVDIPHETEPEKLAQIINQPALIQFVDYQGNVLLDSTYVSAAKAEYGSIYGSETSRHYISITFTPEGHEIFKAITKEIASYPEGSNFLEVKMEGKTISKPIIDSKYADTGIDSSAPIIVLSPNATEEYAKHVAKLISSRNLYFALEVTDIKVIDPILGDNSLSKFIISVIIGSILIMLYFLITYRIPGSLANAVLVIYFSLFLLVMSITKATLTLSGIAGIIFAVSLYADTNIIIFSRLKKELKSGSSLESAIDEAFRISDSVIIDINIALIIIAFIMLWFGPATFSDFGRTLLIGLILSLICIRFITKPVLYSFSKTPYKNHSNFGYRGSK